MDELNREFVFLTHQISLICTPYTISLQFFPHHYHFPPILWYLTLFGIFSKLALFFFVTEAQSFTSPDQIPLRLEVHVYLPCGKRKR